MSEEMKFPPTRYGIGNREMKPSPHGTWLRLEDVAEYLEYCLDDDSLREQRLYDFQVFLKGREP